MLLLKIFLSFFRIGLFAIGGAYSFLPLIENEVVDRYHWLTKGEFFDVLGVSQLFPGAISVKYATYTGHKLAGIPGAIVANIGNIFIPACLILAASGLYSRYKDMPAVSGALNMVHIAIFAMIIAVALRMMDLSQFMHIRTAVVAITCFVLFYFTKVHPAFIIIGAGILGVFLR